MDWNALWQGVLSDAVYALLILGGGAVLATLRLKWPSYSEPARYGAIGAACVAVILFVLTGRGLLVKQQPETTTENVENNVRKWADSLGVGVTKMSAQGLPIQNAYFSLVLTLQNGNPLWVYRTKEKPGYLQIMCPITLAPEHLAILDKLTKDQADVVTQEVLLELARSNFGYQMMTSLGPPAGGSAKTPPTILQQTIILIKSVPIGNGLTEATFVQNTNEVDSAISLVRAATALALGHYHQK